MTDRNTWTRRARRGFSLLELMLVLIIIGLLSAVAAVAVVNQAGKARIQATKASMNTINNAIRQYQMQKGAPPATFTALWTEGFLEPGTGEKDAWKQDFYYRLREGDTARPYELMSGGPDMELGTDDDIDVWTMNQDAD
jgi:general secretion pathway protein G